MTIHRRTFLMFASAFIAYIGLGSWFRKADSSTDSRHSVQPIQIPISPSPEVDMPEYGRGVRLEDAQSFISDSSFVFRALDQQIRLVAKSAHLNMNDFDLTIVWSLRRK